MTNKERAKAWIKTWLDHPCLMPSNAHAREQDLISILNQVQAETLVGTHQPTPAEEEGHAMSKGFQKAFDDARERGETRCSVCLSSAHSKEYHVGTRQPTPAEEAYGKTLIPLAEEALAASGELPTVNQATSQGGIPPYTPAASGGALSADSFAQIIKDLREAKGSINGKPVIELSAAHNWIADRIEVALASHDQKVRAEEREKVAAWMIANSFATGHGDTTEDLLSELKWQIEERVQKVRREVLVEIVKTYDDPDMDELIFSKYLHDKWDAIRSIASETVEKEEKNAR